MSRAYRATALGILVLALAIRVGAVAATPHYVPVADPGDYVRHARSIADTGKFPGRGAGLPGASAYRPPLYPYLLAVPYRIGGRHALTLARLLQALVGTLTVLLTGLLGRRLAGPRVGLAAMAIAAVWPSMWLIDASLLSEVVMVPLVLAAILLALRARERGPRAYAFAAACGIAVGLAALTRANGIVLLLAIVVALWPKSEWRSGRAHLPAAVAVGAALLTIAPWTIRNAHVLHRFVPVSTEDGYTLAGTYNPVARAQTRFPAAWVEWYRVPQNLAAVRQVPNTEVDWGDKLRSTALHDLRGHPAYVAKVAWWNLRRVFDLAGVAWIKTDVGGYGLPRWTAYLELVGFALVALVGFVALVRRPHVPERWLLLVPLVLLVPIFFAGYLRFRAPIAPLIAIAAATVFGARTPPRRKGVREPRKSGVLSIPWRRDGSQRLSL